jgi:hypothetical protein
VVKYVKDLIIDKIISHNEIVSIWQPLSKGASKEIWHGMAHEMPGSILNLPFDRIFGTIPESITQADTINILIYNECSANKILDMSDMYAFEVGM